LKNGSVKTTENGQKQWPPEDGQKKIGKKSKRPVDKIFSRHF
jgi:hypothetical protein